MSRVGRNCLLQVSASYKLRLSVGSVKTPVLQGNLGEAERGVYGGLPADARSLFSVPEDEVISEQHPRRGSKR